jgi:hypothetical protein
MYEYKVIPRSRTWLAMLLIGLLAVAVLVLLPKHEPSFQGKSLDQWLEEYNRAGSIENTRAASEAIRAMGTNVLPFLLANLRHRDSPAKLKVFLFAERHHFGWLPAPRLDALVGPSLLALKALGKTAAPAVPALLKIFEAPATSRQGGLGLYSVGPAAIPAFRRACHDTNQTIRINAALYLALPQSDDNGEQPYYCNWYKFRPKSKLQAYVGQPLNPDFPFDLGYLARHDADPAVRRAGVEALANSYPRAPDPGSVRWILGKVSDKDADASVRAAAKISLEQIGVGLPKSP